MRSCLQPGHRQRRLRTTRASRPTQTPEPYAQTDKPSGATRSTSAAGEVRFVGTIRDLDLGCWADLQCAIRVDDQWIALPSSGRRIAAAPEASLGGEDEAHGEFIGITLHGDSADALRARYVGRSAEVFARKVAQTAPERLARGEGALTLGGNTAYFVRLR